MDTVGVFYFLFYVSVEMPNISCLGGGETSQQSLEWTVRLEGLY